MFGTIVKMLFKGKKKKMILRTPTLCTEVPGFESWLHI